ncbi:MAG: peptidoglycan binding domain-containing protein, partial [Armatimonadetes bacterium]|nr:peptidoglycan binding domain-containing protein [Armatimonadota bacterium]
MIKLNPPAERIHDSATVSLDTATDTQPVTPVRRSRAGLIATLVVGGVLAGVGGIAVAGVTKAKKLAAEQATVFAPGVQIANIALAGKSRETGTEAIRAWAKEQLTTNYVALETPVSGKRFLIPLNLAGARYDTDSALSEAFAVGKNESVWERLLHAEKEYPVNIKPAFKVDEKPLAAQIEAVGKKIAVSPKSARAKMVGGVLQITTPEQVGYALDAEATRAALLAKGADALADGEPVKMVVVETQPTVTSEVLG